MIFVRWNNSSLCFQLWIYVIPLHCNNVEKVFTKMQTDAAANTILYTEFSATQV